MGLRYLLSRRSFVAFISAVAIGGLALSVAVLIVVLSVINGFERELAQRVFSILPHSVLYQRNPGALKEDDLARTEATPGVVGAAAFVQGAALAANGDEVAGILLTGIDPDYYDRVSKLSSFLETSTGEQAGGLEAGDFSLWLGARVAQQLNIGLGDKVVVILPDASVTPVGVFPRQKRFTVSALLRSNSELDSRGAYINLSDAQKLFRLPGGVHGIHLATNDLFAAEDIGENVLSELGFDRFLQRSWMRSHGNLYRAIALQRSTMFVLLSLLVGLAAFNLVSTLVMVVNERRSDISVLRSMGSNGATVVGVFLVLGLAIGAVGIGLGVAFGVLLALLLEHGYAALTGALGLDLMSQYFVNYLPVEIRPGDLLEVSLVAFGLCLLSAVYPAWSASRLQPSTVLRYE